VVYPKFEKENKKRRRKKNWGQGWGDQWAPYRYIGTKSQTVFNCQAFQKKKKKSVLALKPG